MPNMVTVQGDDDLPERRGGKTSLGRTDSFRKFSINLQLLHRDLQFTGPSATGVGPDIRQEVRSFGKMPGLWVSAQ